MTSLTRKVLAASIAAEIVLICVGVLNVPSSLFTLSGAAEPVAIVGLLTVVAILGWIGPLSIPRLGPAAGITVLVAIGFALAYDGLLLVTSSVIRCQRIRTGSS